jgi:hypothetical protein
VATAPARAACNLGRKVLAAMTYRNVYTIEHDPVKNDALERAATGASHRIETNVLAATTELAEAAFRSRFDKTDIRRISIICTVDISVEMDR